MGDPEITPVNIVLDQNQASAGAEVTLDSLNHLPLPRMLMKMESIGHNNSIQRGQIQGLGKIGGQVVDSSLGKLRRQRSFLGTERSPVFVHRVNFRAGTKQLG
jgi:hypothetical protein